MSTVLAIAEAVAFQSVPAHPSSGFALVKGVNMKTVQSFDLPLPANSRAVIESLRIVTKQVDTLSDGATLKVEQYDPSLVASRGIATLSTNLTGANNDLTLTTLVAGTGGNAITLALLDPSGNNQALSVGVIGTAIAVSLATGGAGAITSTAALVLAAILAKAEAVALVSASLKAGNDGTGVVTALAATPLAGGTNPDIVQSIVDSVALADSAAVNQIQALTVAATKAVSNGSSLRFTISNAATATTHVADILAKLTLF